MNGVCSLFHEIFGDQSQGLRQLPHNSVPNEGALQHHCNTFEPGIVTLEVDLDILGNREFLVLGYFICVAVSENYFWACTGHDLEGFVLCCSPQTEIDGFVAMVDVGVFCSLSRETDERNAWYGLVRSVDLVYSGCDVCEKEAGSQ